MYRQGSCILKGGNKSPIAGGHHLVNVSQGMTGVRWLWEEWKANMAELEVSIVFDERKCLNQEQFLYRTHYLLDVFKLFMEGKFPNQGRGFSKYDEF